MVQEKTAPPTEPRPTNTSVLELGTLVSHDVVRIDGTSYYLASIPASSLRTKAKLKRAFERVLELEQLADPTEDDEREYHQRLQELAAMALPDAPPDVLVKLNLEQLGDLATAFFGRAITPQKVALLERAGRISARSSHGSNGSTAATRSAGST